MNVSLFSNNSSCLSSIRKAVNALGIRGAQTLILIPDILKWVRYSTIVTGVFLFSKYLGIRLETVKSAEKYELDIKKQQYQYNPKLHSKPLNYRSNVHARLDFVRKRTKNIKNDHRQQLQY